MYDAVGKIKNNIRLFSFCKSAIAEVSPKEHGYRSFVREIGKIDSVSDFQGFKEAISPILSMDKIYKPYAYGEESFHYGYYDELLRYAGKKRGRVTLIPSFEHGIRFTSAVPPFQKYSLSCACEGRKRIKEIHDVDPWKLVFCIGPYIHYARDMYNRERFKELKKKLGKTLLVFPSHTCEGEGASSENKNIVSTVMKKYSHLYDSILVCMYWNDVRSAVSEQFEAEGANMVSAGFRGDRAFIRRLKTIIRLADAVVVDDIGTNIGFSIYMGKKVYFEGTEQPQSEDAMFRENYSDFRRAFTADDMCFDDVQISRQRELYESFWGGEKELLSREQARVMLEALEDICGRAAFRIDRMEAAERSFLYEYTKDSEAGRIIRSALSPKLTL
jgi:hypothetical protein